MKRLTFLFLLGLVFVSTVPGQKPKPTPTPASRNFSALDAFIDEELRNEWFPFAVENGEVFEFGKGRFTKTGDIAKVWIRVVDKDTSIVFSQMLYEFNCAKDELRAISGAIYYEFPRTLTRDLKTIVGDKKEKLVKPITFDDKSVPYRAVVPDSRGELMYVLACNFKKN